VGVREHVTVRHFHPALVRAAGHPERLDREEGRRLLDDAQEGDLRVHGHVVVRDAVGQIDRDRELLGQIPVPSSTTFTSY